MTDQEAVIESATIALRRGHQRVSVRSVARVVAAVLGGSGYQWSVIAKALKDNDSFMPGARATIAQQSSTDAQQSSNAFKHDPQRSSTDAQQERNLRAGAVENINPEEKELPSLSCRKDGAKSAPGGPAKISLFGNVVPIRPKRGRTIDQRAAVERDDLRGAAGALADKAFMLFCELRPGWKAEKSDRHLPDFKAAQRLLTAGRTHEEVLGLIRDAYEKLPSDYGKWQSLAAYEKQWDAVGESLVEAARPRDRKGRPLRPQQVYREMGRDR